MREDSSWWFNSTARRECGASPHVGFEFAWYSSGTYLPFTGKPRNRLKIGAAEFIFAFFSFFSAVVGASPTDGFANRMNSVKRGFSALLRYIAY